MPDFRTDGRSQPRRLFPSFVLGGFECSTPINFDKRRIDEIALTHHDSLLARDYHGLRAVGIKACRDGVRWNLVDTAGRLDFSSVMPFVLAAEEHSITVIWDLFHYGYPDDLDPFTEPFVDRFRAYCRAFASILVRRGHGDGDRFYTPVNEISFFSWAGGEVGIFAPHQIGRGGELKQRLARAAIAGMDAIREVDPQARFVHCDPLCRVVAPMHSPWLAEDAALFNDARVHEAWDILAGIVAPELGGTSSHLDIVGVNYYGVNQWEHLQHESVLAEDDPRRVPFSRMLIDLNARYGRPILVAETSSIDCDRPQWLRRIARECRIAMEAGVDLHGLCVYPVIGMADWHTGEYRAMGLWDEMDKGDRRRSLNLPTFAAVRTIQRVFGDAPVPARRIEVQPIASRAA